MSYYCPRCKAVDVIEYPTLVECPHCLLMFDKRQIGVIPDDEILALAEVGAFVDAFEELKNPETAKRFFDSIMDDLKEGS